MFTDGTNRRQIGIQNLVIGLLEDEMMKPYILSSAIISENETSEKQVEAIISKVRFFFPNYFYNKWVLLTSNANKYFSWKHVGRG